MLTFSFVITSPAGEEKKRGVLFQTEFKWRSGEN